MCLVNVIKLFGVNHQRVDLNFFQDCTSVYLLKHFDVRLRGGCCGTDHSLVFHGKTVPKSLGIASQSFSKSRYL